MPPARSEPLRQAARPGKRGFANRVSGFVKRALPPRPVAGFPLLWIACGAATALMIVTGGFNTGAASLWPRTQFWVLLMGWNALKWQLVLAYAIRKPSDWPRVSLLATLPLNLPLPFEIAVCARATGLQVFPHLLPIWGRALAISATIFIVCTLVAWVLYRRAGPAETVAHRAGGLLDRAGVPPEALLAIEAEDHYCRVRSRDGQSALIHYRFGDAIAEMTALDGTQVHRGAWVASGAVAGATRDGRRWRLLLTDGSSVPVSATYAAEARRRHWLRPAPRTA